ncbi:MAG: hypothetical protein ACTS7E_03810 [Arsenophonus sp. NC-CH8-MAG3]
MLNATLLIGALNPIVRSGYLPQLIIQIAIGDVKIKIPKVKEIQQERCWCVQKITHPLLLLHKGIQH